MLSCCAPELRASPTHFEEGGVRGSNVWSEKEFGKSYNKQSTSDVQRRQYPLLACHAEVGQAGGRPPKPFASNPLLDRDDSLVHEGSLLSLVASDCETKRSFDEDVPSTPQTAFRQDRKPKPFESSPLIGRDDSLVQGGSLLSLIASQDETLNYEEEMVPSTPQVSYAKYDSRVLRTPSWDASASSLQLMPPPPSPALELSMARQQATQMMRKLNMRRELSRGSMFRKVDSVISSGSVAKSTKDLSLHTQPAEEKSVAGSVSVHDRANGGSVSSHSVSAYDCLIAPPVWDGEDNIHPELKGTYQYPRLFAHNPIHIIGQNELPWWYRLSKKMDTTLPHAFESHWQEIEPQQKESSTNNTSSDALSNESGQLILADNNPCSSDAVVDLCSNTTPPRPRQTQQQNCSSTDSLHNVSFGNLSDISPTHAWSEPVASTMKIRGKTYATDGVKVESDTALFACLGVDSFISGEGGAKENSNTTHYVERWKKVCKEVGLDTTPFL